MKNEPRHDRFDRFDRPGPIARTARRPAGDGGSVIIMVVGLLVLLAMIGSTFIIVSYYDRREAQSIANAAPIKEVAAGVLQRILAERAADLYIDDKGTANTSDDVIYGSAGDYKDQIDYPDEDCDKSLATHEPFRGIWLHLTNLYGETNPAALRRAVDDPNLVDTDGYAVEYPANSGTFYDGDALLWDSGIPDRAGRNYFVAVTLRDLSGLVNVNTAYQPAAAVAGTSMPVTNVSLAALTDTNTRNWIHDGDGTFVGRVGSSTGEPIANFNANYVRRPANPVVTTYRPYDAGDMLAILWRGTLPNVATGRLYQALDTLDLTTSDPTDTLFDTRKEYMTAFSAARDYVTKRDVPSDVKLAERVDLNTASFEDLFKAFYNAIPENVPGMPAGDSGRRRVAAQLAVNVIDFRDIGDAVTARSVPGFPGEKVFGIERQPFVTELFYKVTSNFPAADDKYSAIELFNPYGSELDLSEYRLTVDGTIKVPVGGWDGRTIHARSRIVIVSDTTTIPVPRDVHDDNVFQVTGLDLDKEVRIYRDRAGGIKDVLLAKVGVSGVNPAPGESKSRVYQWNDDQSQAKYTLDLYNSFSRDYTNASAGGAMTTSNTNLGRANDEIEDVAHSAEPCPVFVRNGKFINIGELDRIFYVGPSDNDSLREKLGDFGSVANGRFYALGNIWRNPVITSADPLIPDLPPACMLGDYMGVLTPDPLNTGRTDTIYGQINVNTAPAKVIASLPGISELPQGTREKIAGDILAYRDMKTSPLSGSDYTNRPTATGIPNLRNEPGLASAGEAAIPILGIASPMPNNIYSPQAPDCYAIGPGGYDDGLGAIVGDLTKYDVYYNWLSNQLTVRSDAYVAYIAVFGSSGLGCSGEEPAFAAAAAATLTDSAKQWRADEWKGALVVVTDTTTNDVQVRKIDSNTETVLAVEADWNPLPASINSKYQILTTKRRYLAVIDRSNCRSVKDMPDVLLFAPIE